MSAKISEQALKAARAIMEYTHNLARLSISTEAFESRTRETAKRIQREAVQPAVEIAMRELREDFAAFCRTLMKETRYAVHPSQVAIYKLAEAALSKYSPEPKLPCFVEDGITIHRGGCGECPAPTVNGQIELLIEALQQIAGIGKDDVHQIAMAALSKYEATK